jgi:hypothetical protein
MGRTKIHLTAEAKREANRAKSKRHYDKYILSDTMNLWYRFLIFSSRSKAEINAQRCKIYHRTKAMYSITLHACTFD